MDFTFILNELQSLSLHEPFSSREIAGGPESLGMQAIAPRQYRHLFQIQAFFHLFLGSALQDLLIEPSPYTKK